MTSEKNIYEIMADGELEAFVTDRAQQLFSNGITDMKTIYLKGLMDGYEIAIEKGLQK